MQGVAGSNPVSSTNFNRCKLKRLQRFLFSPVVKTATHQNEKMPYCGRRNGNGWVCVSISNPLITPFAYGCIVCVAGMDGQTVNAENDATRFAMVTTGSPKPDSQPSSERALTMRWMLNDRIQAFITKLPGKDTRQGTEMACWPGKADANTLHGAGGWTSY